MTRQIGIVAAIHRYPVKSMMGEELNAARIGARGLLGDRVFSLADPATGKIASAKNPSRWPALFSFRATFTRPPEENGALPPARITFPDGGSVSTEDKLKITGPCGRCVMTTLARGDLPKDNGILKTAAQHNQARVGAYASVLQGGKVQSGDAVCVESG
ncbi:MAG TPA: MOSC N-terminal beta barrel domain-containing protein [Verrucomicrobiae bacterium]|nr:MOSC N-terminal beta barrel domain-containing protein [Verrucomicrobiae bacterium]